MLWHLTSLFPSMTLFLLKFQFLWLSCDMIFKKCLISSSTRKTQTPSAKIKGVKQKIRKFNLPFLISLINTKIVQSGFWTSNVTNNIILIMQIITVNISNPMSNLSSVFYGVTKKQTVSSTLTVCFEKLHQTIEPGLQTDNQSTSR